MNTHVISAYISVILIWSTTPLGIKWSGGQGISFLFGMSARMAIACVLALLLVSVLRIPYHLTRKALLAYMISGLGIYGAMLFAYWGATYVPSGWLSVIWGTSPVFTGILAQRFLGESLSWNRLFGLLLSISGLAVIFLHSGETGERAWLGVLLVVSGVLVQSGTAVWLKHLNANEHGLMMTATGLLFSLPLFVLTWWLFDGVIPQSVPVRAGLSIVYLAVFGSLLGFSLYYFLINHIEASKLALVTLVTPVTSLLIGRFLNDEPLTMTVYTGTGLILLGLASYQWGKRFQNVKTSHSLLAILLTIAASSILAGMDSLGKILMRDFSTFQVTWARFLFHSIMVSLIFFWQGQRDFIRTRAPKTQLLRGLCMVGINTSLYMAIQTVSLAEATALMYLSPVLVTLLAGVLLGETIMPRHLLAVAAGFAGVLVIIRPGFQTFEPALLLAIFASFLLALYFLLTRKVAIVDNARTSLFYTSIVGAVVLSGVVHLWWKAPEPWQWLLLASMGALGATGHFLLIKAYSLLPASELSPWLNAQVVAATVFSVFLFQDALGWNFFVGSGLIIAAGMILWLHNRIRG